MTATRGRRWRIVVLTIAAVYFLLPLLAAAEFSLRVPGAGYGLTNWLAIFFFLTAGAGALVLAFKTLFGD